MTREEIERGIELGDPEVLNAVMSGEIESLLQENTEEATDEVVDQPTEQVEIAQEPELADVPEEPVIDEEKQQLMEELTFLREKYSEFSSKPQEPVVDEATKALQEQLEEQRRLINELREQKVNEPTTEPIVFNDDPDEDEIADRYTRETRENLKKLAQQAVSKQDLQSVLEKINQLSAAESQREKEAEDRRAQEAIERNKRLLFDEVSRFQEANREFETPTPISQMYDEVSAFKQRISGFIRSDDNREVEKAYHSIVSGKTQEDEKLRAEIAKVGIKVPEGIDKYQQLTEIVDLKDGVRYNRYTGDLEDITDPYGNKVVQRSIDDAYKLSTYYDRITEARKQAAKEVQQKLVDRENSAVVMDNNSTTGDENGNIAPDRLNALLDMSNSQLMKDPNLMKEYQKAMTQLGIAS